MKMARLVFLLLLFIAPARAAEPARFLIERIDVRHLVHVSPEVIKSESRLHEGQTVTENELRDANSRIKRLPFVLDATFSLERGSARDAFVLVISVNETRPMFYLAELVPYARARNTIGNVDNAALFGGRLFAGRNGAFHLALVGVQGQRPFDSDYYSSVQAGYTQYGLFGGRAFATLTLSRYIAHGERGSTLPGGVMGIALAANQTLTISYSAFDIRSPQSRRTERNLEWRYAYDTTNHPFFPTRGTLMSVAPILTWKDFFSSIESSAHDATAGLETHAARYWPLDERLSFAAIGEGGVEHLSRNGGALEIGPRATVFYGSATLRLSRALGDPNASTETERRVEFSLRGVSRERNYLFYPRDSAAQLSVAWVRRDAWGVLRLGLGYSW
jgi:hypothetical protein